MLSTDFSSGYLYMLMCYFSISLDRHSEAKVGML